MSDNKSNSQSKPKRLNGGINTFVPASKLVPSVVYDTYWRFAAERQRVFFRRLAQSKPPWTDDEILRTYKFTNAFRASDRVSQYLIRKVIYEGSQEPEELFFRIILFKLFNKIETWELISTKLGQITTESFDFDKFDRVLSDAQTKGIRIYSAAYIMPSGSRTYGFRKKHQAHLVLLRQMLDDEVPSRICDSGRFAEGYKLLLSYPMIGPFLAYQYMTDLNYSEMVDFGESDFVVPGPGARDGLHKCFHGGNSYNEADCIKYVTDQQENEFERLGIDFKSLWGRRLQYIDCQNLFCEIAKYARVSHPEFLGHSGRTKIKQRFRPRSIEQKPWYPPKWELNEKILTTRKA